MLRGKTAPLPTCWLFFFATPWYGNKYKIPPAARPSKPLLDLLTRQRLFQWTLLRHESLAALAQHAMTRPRWPGAVPRRVFFAPLPWRCFRSVQSRPANCCCTEMCSASTHSGSAERWQTASAITPAAIQSAAKISTAMLRTASASGSMRSVAQFSAGRPPPLWRLYDGFRNCLPVCLCKSAYLKLRYLLLVYMARSGTMLVCTCLSSVSRTRRICVTHAT